MIEEYLDILQDIPLFDRIKREELKPMLSCIGGYIKTYEKGSFIPLKGDTYRCIGLVLLGKVQMIKEDIWGETSIYAVISPRNIFGETFLNQKKDQEENQVTFLAVEDCTILFMPFERLMHTCPSACAFHYRLVENMVIQIAHKNILLMEKLEVTSKKTIREKILTYLSEQAKKQQKYYFTIPLGRTELANYLCVDRSALTRELSRLRDEKVIDFDKNTFRIVDKTTYFS